VNDEKLKELIVEVAKSSSAFSHPLRIEIYRFILENNAKFKAVKNKDIVKKFKLAQSTTSEHLNKLSIGGLISKKSKGTATFYSANFVSVEKYLKNLDALVRILGEEID
jgi:DNA-binding transcriptional ArsR family regulator